MSRKDKLVERIKARPRDFTYQEAKRLLENFGFVEDNKGKTSGSRVVFVSREFLERMELHKPHPHNILKRYQIDIIIGTLKRVGVI